MNKLAINQKMSVFKRNKPIIIILTAIIIVGVFLRTYEFHDWLFFWDDQVRDARLVINVIEKKAPWPLLGPHMLFTEYHLGPMYYYFQILSANIFGAEPHVLAYPDVLFGILSIPLFFVFLRRYFDPRLSLGLTGLYSLSFFAIRFSRFSWNINLIPFFSLLFLVSLHEIINRRSETKWWWIVALGISIGIGIQLHAIVLLLMFAVAGLAFFYTIWIDWRVWARWVAVLFIVLSLNAGSILFDLQNDFSNSKAFIAATTKKSEKSGEEPIKILGRDIDCHIQVGYHILTSFGNRDYCEFPYTSAIQKIVKNIEKQKSLLSKVNLGDTKTASAAIYGTAFLGFGLILLLYFFRNEKNPKKKQFLGLIIAYLSLSFLVLLPVNEMLKPRYFLQISFIPLFFLGLILKYITDRIPRGQIAVWMIVPIIAAMNIITISQSAIELSKQSASRAKNPILGELESIAGHIIEQSEEQKTAYLAGTKENLFTFYAPLAFVAERQGFLLRRYEEDETITENTPLFYITRNSDKSRSETSKKGREIIHRQELGSVIIYKLEN